MARSSDAEPETSDHVGEDDPFFLLYTGGTTGQSKGALHTHRSAAAGMLNQTVAERIVPTDVYMLTGQMYHIPIVLAMNYLKHGCPLVLMNFAPKLALDLIENEKVSAFLGVTTMLNWMMAEENFAGYDLSSLRNIQYGGGPMPSHVVRQALDSFPCTLIQGYGQTEGTTMTFLSQEDHLDAVKGIHPERLRSCGREGFVTSVRVVDFDGNDVPQRRQHRRRDHREAARPTWSATSTGPTSPPARCATGGCGPATSRRGTRTATSSSSTAPRT